MNEEYRPTPRREVALWVLVALAAVAAMVGLGEALRHDHPAAGVQTPELTEEIDPLREDAHRTLMQLYADNGNLGSSAYVYRRCRAVLRDELDMKVIDLNTSSVASYEPAYLEKVREAARDAGCVLTNLKLNQRGLDMNSPDADVRERA
ncbi:MAG: bacterial transcriptional activator domain-containing protein, partial [Actinomycetota bacterium]